MTSCTGCSRSKFRDTIENTRVRSAETGQHVLKMMNVPPDGNVISTWMVNGSESSYTRRHRCAMPARSVVLATRLVNSAWMTRASETVTSMGATMGSADANDTGCTNEKWATSPIASIWRPAEHVQSNGGSGMI